MNTLKRLVINLIEPDSLISSIGYSEPTVALALCYRDWKERLDDAGAEIGLTAGGVTRIFHSCLREYMNDVWLGDSYPFNTKNMSDDDITSIRGVGGYGLSIIRMAEKLPREPMECLTDEERHYLEKYSPGFNFTTLEIQCSLYFE